MNTFDWIRLIGNINKTDGERQKRSREPDKRTVEKRVRLQENDHRPRTSERKISQWTLWTRINC